MTPTHHSTLQYTLALPSVKPSPSVPEHDRSAPRSFLLKPNCHFHWIESRAFTRLDLSLYLSLAAVCEAHLPGQRNLSDSEKHSRETRPPADQGDTLFIHFSFLLPPPSSPPPLLPAWNCPFLWNWWSSFFICVLLHWRSSREWPSVPGCVRVKLVFWKANSAALFWLQLWWCGSGTSLENHRRALWRFLIVMRCDRAGARSSSLAARSAPATTLLSINTSSTWDAALVLCYALPHKRNSHHLQTSVMRDVSIRSSQRASNYFQRD